MHISIIRKKNKRLNVLDLFSVGKIKNKLYQHYYYNIYCIRLCTLHLLDATARLKFRLFTNRRINRIPMYENRKNGNYQ